MYLVFYAVLDIIQRSVRVNNLKKNSLHMCNRCVVVIHLVQPQMHHKGVVSTKLCILCCPCNVRAKQSYLHQTLLKKLTSYLNLIINFSRQKVKQLHVYIVGFRVSRFVTWYCNSPLFNKKTPLFEQWHVRQYWNKLKSYLVSACDWPLKKHKLCHQGAATYSYCCKNRKLCNNSPLEVCLNFFGQ